MFVLVFSKTTSTSEYQWYDFFPPKFTNGSVISDQFGAFQDDLMDKATEKEMPRPPDSPLEVLDFWKRR